MTYSFVVILWRVLETFILMRDGSLHVSLFSGPVVISLRSKKVLNDFFGIYYEKGYKLIST